VTVSAAALRRAVYGAIVVGALLIALGLLAAQLVTLLLAVMFTIIISLPLGSAASAFERRGWPRPIGALVALLAGLAALGGVIALLVPRVSSQVNQLINAAPGIVRGVEVRIGQITGEKPGHVAATLQHDVSTWVHKPSNLLGPLATIGLSAATIIGGLIIAIITAYYIAARPAPLVNGLMSLFPARRRDDVVRVMARLRAAWLAWLRGLSIAMLLIGLLLYGALTVFVGLHYALSFAVLSALAEVVPYLGALLSGIPPVAYALTVSPGTAIAVLAIYVAVHQIEANFIGPIVMSRTVHLHPVVIALGVVAVGQVFGFLGLIIAVPILSAIVILGEELWVRPLERTRAARVGRRDGDRSEALKR
jgi:predicted PurR-regulated permease PerM